MDLQKEGMKLWQEWLGNSKKTRDEFSKLMGEGFDRAEEFFAPPQKDLTFQKTLAAQLACW